MTTIRGPPHSMCLAVRMCDSATSNSGTDSQTSTIVFRWCSLRREISLYGRQRSGNSRAAEYPVSGTEKCGRLRLISAGFGTVN